MQGRRVEPGESLFEALSQPGDYCPIFDGDTQTIKWLWMRLPSGSLGRIANEGYGVGDENEWEITLEADGTVTVDPSIEQPAIAHPTEPVPYWHGHLKHGVWE